MKNIFFLLSLPLFIMTCSSSIFMKGKKNDLNKVLHEIIFTEDILNNGGVLARDSSEIILIHPILKFRPILYPHTYYGHNDTIKSTNIMLPFSIYTDSVLILIPKKMKDTYEYFSEKIDVKQFKSPTIYFLSNLLPTKKKNVYLLQIIDYSSIDYEGISYRSTYRYFNKYLIIGKSYKHIGVINTPDSYTW